MAKNQDENRNDQPTPAEIAAAQAEDEKKSEDSAETPAETLSETPAEVAAPEANSPPDNAAEVEDVVTESSTSTTEVYSALTEIADELQLWFDRKETMSGSHCVMDALPEAIGLIRSKADKYK